MSFNGGMVFLGYHVATCYCFWLVEGYFTPAPLWGNLQEPRMPGVVWPRTLIVVLIFSYVLFKNQNRAGEMMVNGLSVSFACGTPRFDP